MTPRIMGNLRSRTNWLAVLTAVIGYLQLPDTQRMIGKLLSGSVEAETLEMILASLTIACGIAAIIVRNVTVEPVTAKAKR